MIRLPYGGTALCLLGLARCGSGPILSCPVAEPGGGGPIAAPGDGSETGSSPTDPADGEAAPGTPGTTPADAQADAPSGGDPTPEPEVLRFVALGDGGRGNDEQYRVADAIQRVCLQRGCDFAIYLGDNIYDDGVESVDDPAFEEKFEAPYRDVDLPFYMALGNHDWGGDAGAQVEYTYVSEKWEMPDVYYSHVQGQATFIALDTNSLTDGDQAQMDWARAEVTAASTPWRFAYGHHPYVSNGEHGNTGGDFEEFFDEALCGNVDVYFAGHDHDLEWLEPVCGTEFVISGAASSLREVGGDNPTFFETSTLGFLWVEIVDRTLTGVFYDDEADELFRRTLHK